MMPSMSQQKERIVSLLKLKGPSLPVQIAKGIGVEPLFASAFLSELFRENKIKMSNMRVGSSPLYYIEGQDDLLERFVEHLNSREKESFLLLQKNRVLDDEAQSPVMRVALRAIKDFAISVRVRTEGNAKLYWKYFRIKDDEFKEMVQESISGKILVKSIESEIIANKEEKLDESISKKVEEIKVEKSIEVNEEVEKAKVEKSITYERESKVEEFANVKKEVKVRKEKKIQENLFSKKIKNYLKGRDIELLDVFLERKKEIFGRVRINMLFGKQEFYLVAKDKKNVSDNDLAIALQKAQAFKMPILFMSSGELQKKGRDYLSEWKNLVMFEKLR